MTKLQLLVERSYTRCKRDASKNLYFHISCMALGNVALKICGKQALTGVFKNGGYMNVGEGQINIFEIAAHSSM